MDEDSESCRYVHLLDESPYLPPKRTRIEELEPKQQLAKWKDHKLSQVELKPLPLTPMYEFLGPNSTYSMIISASLNEGKLEKTT